ncbi:MAG: CRISPR-associated endonuclease Cas2 [Candidatus Paceibacterota bacterium]|jgi:CRISPR-associated endonuclease Cas2
MSKHNYKGVWVNSFGIPTSSPDFDKRKKENRKNKVRDTYNVSFQSNFKKESPKKLIVMYDISHDQKTERDWLRRHLKKFGYVMIQRSVWVGPSPLPKSFVDYIKSIGLKDNLKTFRLAKEYSEKNNIFN